jgi:hypothetical protein
LVIVAPDTPGVASDFGLKLRIFHPKISAVKGPVDKASNSHFASERGCAVPRPAAASLETSGFQLVRAHFTRFCFYEPVQLKFTMENSV